MSPPEVLRLGARGEAVRDLQHRLTEIGQPCGGDEAGHFGPSTEAAVRAFQDSRGLRVDGRCGPHTWAALVESGFILGDRLLYQRTPNLRGDDVTELQQRLNALGFDAGREDGILGPQTAGALRDFQRNSGLAVDGILGPSTVNALDRFKGLAAGSVAQVREREVLRSSTRTIEGHRVFLAVAPGMEALGELTLRSLTAAGAHVVVDASGASDSDLATRANELHADLCLALRAGGHRPECSYFAKGGFHSESGLAVARRVREELDRQGPGPELSLCGRTHPLLRETRMAAVVCEPVVEGDAAAMRTLVAASARVAAAITRGVRHGIEDRPD